MQYRGGDNIFFLLFWVYLFIKVQTPVFILISTNKRRKYRIIKIYKTFTKVIIQS